MNLEELDNFRCKKGEWRTKKSDRFGLFFIPTRPGKPSLKVICAPMNSEWQHVSVSLPARCPTWNEMSKIKDLFWADCVTVMQFHPRKTNYVNIHKYCLHLWSKKGVVHELPPEILV